MADKTVDIEIKTTGDGSGAQQVQRDLEKIELAQRKVTDATKAEAEAEAKLTEKIQAKVDAIAKEEEARAEAATRAGRGNGPTGEADATADRSIATLGKVAVAVGVVAGAWRLLRVAAEEGADAGDAGAKRTLEGLETLTTGFKSLLGSLAGSKAGQAVGEFAAEIGRVIGPSKEARQQLDAMNEAAAQTAERFQTAKDKVSEFSKEVRDATAATAADNALNSKVASEEEARLQLFKRRQLAAIDPAGSPEEQARKRAEIEKQTLEESQRIKEDLARRDIENADALAQKKREEATKLDAVGKREEAEKAREEARKLDLQSASRAAARQRERVTEADTSTTVQEEQARLVEQARMKEEAATQKEQDAAAKRESEKTAKEAAALAKEEARRAEKFGISPNDPSMGKLIANAGTVADQAQAGIPFGERDPNVRALREATRALEDGGTTEELAALGAALDKFSATLQGLRFKDKLANLEKQIEALEAREGAERK